MRSLCTLTDHARCRPFLPLLTLSVSACMTTITATTTPPSLQAYIETVSFLGNRIDRTTLPNRQDIPIPKAKASTSISTSSSVVQETQPQELPLVPDCELPDVKYVQSVLDKLLLALFRSFVRVRTSR